MKDPSKITKGFEKFLYKQYERKRPKHELTASYSYLASKLAKSIIRADALNSRVYPLRTEITGLKHILVLYVCSMDNSKSKELIVDENLLQVCYTDKSESKIIIFNKSSIEESKSECVHKSVNKEKYAKNKADHE